MKTLSGKIVSVKMIDTVVVEVERQNIHPVYQKIIRRTSRIKAHNKDGSLKIGDMVNIVAIRPISKHKHYKVASKVDKT